MVRAIGSDTLKKSMLSNKAGRLAGSSFLIVALALAMLCFSEAQAARSEPIDGHDGRPSVYNTQNGKWLKTLKPTAETPGVVDAALAGPLKDVDELIFCVRLRGPGHFYESFGHDFRLQDNFSHSPGGGRMLKLNLKSGETSVFMEDLEGAFRDPYLHYSGEKMLFSWRKGGTNLHYIYEIGVDGEGLRQITDGEGGRFDDVEPIYMSNGEIMFVSGRARRGVPCWTTQVGLCYRVNQDGSDVRAVSNGIEHEITPWPLPDGRILYMRWEYINRSATQYHHLWTFNPDGTAVMTYYGNNNPGFAMTEARPIPGTDKVISIFGAGHGRNEREGFLTVIDPEYGPDDKAAATLWATDFPEISKDPECWRDPIALSDEFILTAVEDRIYIVNSKGQFETLYQLEEGYKVPKGRGTWIHEPRLIQGHPREPVIPDRTDFSKRNGQLVLQDVAISRDNRMQRASDRIAELLVVEALPMAVSMSWTADSAFTNNGSYNIKRILGRIPVEEDGSAYLEAPAMRPFYFIALDANGNVVKEMNSFTTLMPGEVASCVGCHEQRTRTPKPIPRNNLRALERYPSLIQPLENVPDSGIYHMPRDIQPIFDKHCTKCHNYEKYAGELVLTGTPGIRFPNSAAWFEAKNINAPRLMSTLARGHHDVKLSDAEMERLKWWTVVDMQVSGTYASFGTAGDECDIPFARKDGPAGQENPDAVALEFDETILEKRCASCHDSGGGNPGHSKYTGRGWPRQRSYDHYFNMAEPEKSLMLLAPLSKEAGGYGLCEERPSRTKYKRRPKDFKTEAPPANVFASKDDPDYQALLKQFQEMSAHLKAQKTFPHAENWRPVGDYIRAMKLYGVLPEDYDYAKNPVDPFRIDEGYYEIFYDGRTGNDAPISIPDLK
ncbi:MAG: hypothetical protein ACLFUS_02880 [Candidatus Sumerlaeia bacterium]